ncbi:hypothetical protein B0T11DRAFT_270515 [Plectosphaerella cucumerina]|uniref:Uncharacterized protein n=1 Tax=Plectosphaerella cucumerina TaxID=40658 RepID=A0A8K0TQL5_9PEZI|nr:hypothetical protein B0T11DRAFT_270515 [Plectosphaerella cucumerina]
MPALPASFSLAAVPAVAGLSAHAAARWADAEKGRDGRASYVIAHEPPAINGVSKLLMLDEAIDKLEGPLLMQLQDTAGFSGW